MIEENEMTRWRMSKEKALEGREAERGVSEAEGG